MPSNHAPVYEFDTHSDAEAALNALRRAGIAMEKLSLIGKGYHGEEHPVGFCTAGDKIKAWGGAGAFWGGIWGLLMTPAVFFFPGFGMVAMAGPVVVALISAAEGAVVLGGASAIGAALSQIGASKEQVIRYETSLKADKYLLLVHGNGSDLALADSVLATTESLDAV